ncbi:MAG: 50S ribosomal protein L21 [uncultured bacterium (gcode 4)]|uniref:Large ribosomal subunit protein bL21 n=1 Tax=uncultured bacterium (gcode 4) TaxID=1234023 RepID=K2FCU0_9BACT|nr:MAG: 50S ribosomal protein L21 [uncultured bacterium (gcode 4)]
MVAVLEIGGNQFIVKKWDIIEVDNQNAEIGSTLKLNPLMVSDEAGKETKVGTPLLNDITVELKVLEDFKDEKVRVYKMKSKKRYSRTKGFRAQKTKLEVLSIA